jgi:predicted outer membrane protein
MLKTRLVFVCALAAGAPSVFADVAPAAKNSKSQSGSVAASGYGVGADSAFMTKAGGDGMAEVELGRLAVDRASSSDVRRSRR